MKLFLAFELIKDYNLESVATIFYTCYFLEWIRVYILKNEKRFVLRFRKIPLKEKIKDSDVILKSKTLPKLIAINETIDIQNGRRQKLKGT